MCQDRFSETKQIKEYKNDEYDTKIPKSTHKDRHDNHVKILMIEENNKTTDVEDIMEK